ncbi:MAG: DM13 domain-containing protein [Cyanobacteria bacterium J06636_27]
MPANFDLDDFKSVAIWCEEFNVTFGFARLQGA